MMMLCSKIEEFMLPCINKTLFGFECMGCGLQRSAALLIRGQFTEAFIMYPAIYTLILLFGVVALSAFKSSKLINKLIIGLAIINVCVILISFIIKTSTN